MNILRKLLSIAVMATLAIGISAIPAQAIEAKHDLSDVSCKSTSSLRVWKCKVAGTTYRTKVTIPKKDYRELRRYQTLWLTETVAETTAFKRYLKKHEPQVYAAAKAAGETVFDITKASQAGAVPVWDGDVVSVGPFVLPSLPASNPELTVWAVSTGVCPADTVEAWGYSRADDAVLYCNIPYYVQDV